jgi:hypothetical protein
MLPLKYSGLAGFLYFTNALWGWTAGSVFGKQRRKVLDRMHAHESVKAKA